MKKTILVILLVALGFHTEIFCQRISVKRIRDAKELVTSRESRTGAKANSHSAIAELATVYPGAIPVNPNYSDGRGEQYGSFYTDDSYEKVRAYYVQEAGNPQVDKNGNEVFVYKQRRADSDRVTIHNSGGSVPQGISKTLRELRGVTDKGFLSVSEYDQIKEKYEEITGFWKTNFCMEIFEKHKKRLDPTTFVVENQQEAQRLILSGRKDEGIALLEATNKELEELVAINQSSRIVDEWIKCLDEIAQAAKDKRNYWDIMINIYSTGKG